MIGFFSDLHADNKKMLGDPPNNTCPLIDKIIEDLNRASSYAREIERDTEYEHRRAGRYCRDEIDDAIVKIEKLRKENERLRDLGREWYANAGDYASIADKMIEELESKIALEGT